MSHPRTLHLGIDKGFLRELISHRGPRDVLTGAASEYTTAEALAMLDEDPRSVFCSCSCRKNANGSCSGQASEDAPRPHSAAEVQAAIIFETEYYEGKARPAVPYRVVMLGNGFPVVERLAEDALGATYWLRVSEDAICNNVLREALMALSGHAERVAAAKRAHCPDCGGPCARWVETDPS